MDRRPLAKVSLHLKGWLYGLAVSSDLVPQRQRKFKDGKQLMKKNAQGILQYNVSIVSARYDSEHHSWMYTLNDWRNERIPGETTEKMLGG